MKVKLFFKFLLFLLIVLPKVSPLLSLECQNSSNCYNISIDRFFYCNYNYGRIFNQITERHYAQISLSLECRIAPRRAPRKRHKDCKDCKDWKECYSNSRNNSRFVSDYNSNSNSHKDPNSNSNRKSRNDSRFDSNSRKDFNYDSKDRNCNANSDASNDNKDCYDSKASRCKDNGIVKLIVKVVVKVVVLVDLVVKDIVKVVKVVFLQS